MLYVFVGHKPTKAVGRLLVVEYGVFLYFRADALGEVDAFARCSFCGFDERRSDAGSIAVL